MIVDFLNRQMPAYLDTGLNYVHVRDVAIGHILAAEKGCIGERYILGNAEGNWTMKRTFTVLEELTGVPRAGFRVPYCGGAGAAYADEALSSFTADRPKPRWPACAWPSTRCISVQPKRFANWVCRKRRPGRRWRTRWGGFVRMDM